MTREQELLVKKEKAESIIADKMRSQEFARIAKREAKDQWLQDVLLSDIERYHLEIEALQAMIDQIDLEIKSKS